MKSLTLFLFLWASINICYAQLSSKFPAETAGYKPIGKPDCQSMNMVGLPPMNTCSQKYSNGKLTITISLTEYPKGNPTIAMGGSDQGDDKYAADYTIEKIALGNAKGAVTYMKKSKMATTSMTVSDKLMIDVNGENQPNGEAVKALAKALKL